MLQSPSETGQGTWFEFKTACLLASLAAVCAACGGGDGKRAAGDGGPEASANGPIANVDSSGLDVGTASLDFGLEVGSPNPQLDGGAAGGEAGDDAGASVQGDAPSPGGDPAAVDGGSTVQVNTDGGLTALDAGTTQTEGGVADAARDVSISGRDSGASTTSTTPIGGGNQPTGGTGGSISNSGAGASAGASAAVDADDVLETGAVIDRRTPDTVITGGPAAKTAVAATDAPFQFVFSGTDDQTPSTELLFRWRLDGGSWNGPSAATTAKITDLADGRHTFEVAAIDADGNIDPSPASREFAVVSYTATLGTSVVTAPVGTTVPFSGRASLVGSGQPAANVAVSVVVAIRGMSRVFSATTGSDGTFQLTFTPLPTEAGEYTAGAKHPADYAMPAQAQFSLVGMSATPSTAALRIASNGQAAGQITLANLGDSPLTGLTAVVSGGIAGVEVTTNCPTELPASGSAVLGYTLAASGASPASGSIQLTISSAEGSIVKATLSVAIVPASPSLVVTPDHIDAGMLVGATTSFELQVQNTGGASSAPLDVQLPNIAWMSLASAATIEPLKPGESAKVMLSLSPPAALTLGSHKGAIVVGSLSVPFNLFATSDAKGSVNILAQDELSYYDKDNNYPNLAGAKVTLQSAATQTVAASGTTATDGSLVFSSIPVGTYYLSVEADRHTSYKATLQVQAGSVTRVSAFLSLQLVTYDWSVEPTTVSDVYNFQVETHFETNVPLPVITIDPAYVDLRDLGCGEQREVDFKISNQGLITATNLRFDLQSGSDVLIAPLVSALGDLAANSSITVPVIFTGQGSLCSTPNVHRLHEGPVLCLPPALYVIWDVICGDLKRQLQGVFFSGPHDPRCDPYPTPTAPSLFSGIGGDSGGLWVAAPGLSNSLGGLSIGVSPNYVPPPLPDLHVNIPCDPCKAALYKGLWGCRDQIAQLAALFSGEGEIALLARKKDCETSELTLDSCVAQAASDKKGECLRKFLSSCGDLSSLLQGWIDCASGLRRAADICSIELGEANTSGDAGSLHKLLKHALGGGAPQTLFEKLRADLDNRDVHASLWSVVFGDASWMSVDSRDASVLSDWFSMFYSAAGAESDGGTTISLAERGKLLAAQMPRPLSVAQVSSFLDRWNRTVAEWAVGDFEFPAGDGIDLHRVSQLGNELVEIDSLASGAGFLCATDELRTDLNGVKDYAEGVPAGVCGAVKVDLDQQAVVSRAAFRATLSINNASSAPMEALSVDLKVLDASGTDASSLFSIGAPSLSGLVDANGSGSIAAGGIASAVWTIVPSDAAAPSGPITYTVSGRISYQLNGTSLEIPLLPATIQVMPLANLTARYFWPKNVFSDDPFTTEIEPAEPFAVGLMISNSGGGIAQNVQITSAQPTIVDNSKGLAVNFTVIGSQVNGGAVTPSLAVNLGDIASGSTGVAEWLMTASLAGTFNILDASIQHVDALGTTRSSLFAKVETHQLVHPVRIVTPTDDGSPDFLVNDSSDPETMPGQVFSSDGSSAGVAQVFAGIQADGTATATSHMVGLTVRSVPSGYVYIRTDDPGQGKFQLKEVIRSDGVALRIFDNAWTTHRTIHPTGKPAEVQNRLHIFDQGSTGSYTLVYGDATDSPWSCAAPVLDGRTCDDGNRCTTAIHCMGGFCLATASVECPVTSACPAGGTCDPSTGFCSCGDCPAGYTGTSSTGCADINECTSNNGGCDPLTTCTNTMGGFQCGGCPDGYVGTGTTGCKNIDDCVSGPCQNGGICQDGLNGFTCRCAPGYSGPTCDIPMPSGASSGDAGVACEGGTCGPTYTVIAAAPTTWSQARDLCASRGEHLVTIDSQAENESVRSMAAGYLGRDAAIWIGLSRQGTTWIWGDGSSAAYTSWHAGEPNNDGGNENFGEMYLSDGTWNDCSDQPTMAYVCENDCGKCNPSVPPATVGCEEVVSNGGFEIPAISGGYVTFNGGDAMGGWVVGEQSIDIVTAAAHAVFEGSQAIDLAGTPGPGAVEQQLSTASNTTFRLKFAVSSNGSAMTDSLTVYWNGQSVTTLSTPGMGTWATYGFDVLATGPTSTLRFEGNLGGNAGALLDAVSLKPSGCE